LVLHHQQPEPSHGLRGALAGQCRPRQRQRVGEPAEPVAAPQHPHERPPLPRCDLRRGVLVVDPTVAEQLMSRGASTMRWLRAAWWMALCLAASGAAVSFAADITAVDPEAELPAAWIVTDEAGGDDPADDVALDSFLPTWDAYAGAVILHRSAPGGGTTFA